MLPAKARPVTVNTCAALACDLILYNGILLTQDPAQPLAEALAVKDGRIIAVGSADDVLNLKTARRLDLAGRTLIPGFNDAHVHLWKVGHLLTGMLDVRGVESLSALKAAITEFAAALPAGAWFMGRGYNEALLAERRHPTRYDLDEVLPDRPAYLVRTCAHIAVANSRALQVAGITSQTPAPSGGIIERDVQGEPNGILHESAMGLVFNHIPPPTLADYEAMIAAAVRHQLALGITSATEPGVMPDLLAVYRDLDARRALVNRLNVMAIRRPDGGSETLPLPERYRSDHLRVDSIKLFADGGLSSANAALSMDYRHKADRGVLRLTFEALYSLAREAHLKGLRVCTHAIGDAAIQTVLDVYVALAKLGASAPAHRVEHFGLPSAADCQRARRLGVIVVPQTVFIHSLGVNFRRCLPDELLERCYPVRMMLDAGLTVALSSDAPVVKEDNPLLGMQAALLRRDFQGEAIAPQQAITAEQALSAYTLGGARASGDEDNRGSLAVGKWADFAVLSDNPLTCPPEALTDIQVEMTLIGGQVVFEK